MACNIRDWFQNKPVPILAFPCAQLLGVSIRELLSSSELQARGMAAVAARVPAGAAVGFMDLSLEASCFGARVLFSEEEVPTVVGALVTDPEAAEALPVPVPGAGRDRVVIEAMTLAAQRITDRPVLAGAIGPFSLAGRLMGVNEAMFNCYDEPEMVHTLLEKVTGYLIGYCRLLRQTGARGILLAEPLAGLLSPALAREFSHTYVKQIISQVQTEDFALIYHNCADSAARMVPDIYRLGAAGYHFGDALDLEKMLAQAPGDVLVMGNISPAEEFVAGTPESMTRAVRQLRQRCGGYPNFLLSSGCDIPPKAPWENIDAFFSS